MPLTRNCDPKIEDYNGKHIEGTLGGEERPTMKEAGGMRRW